MKERTERIKLRKGREKQNRAKGKKERNTKRKKCTLKEGRKQGVSLTIPKSVGMQELTDSDIHTVRETLDTLFATGRSY
jgi:cobalamin-dependent methionine synthase I